MPNPCILVILNPVSGQGNYDQIKSKIERWLIKSAVEFTLRETEGEGDAIGLRCRELRSCHCRGAMAQ